MSDDAKRKKIINEIQKKTFDGLKFFIKPSLFNGAIKRDINEVKSSGAGIAGFVRKLTEKQKPDEKLQYLADIDDYGRRFKISCRIHKVGKDDLKSCENLALFRLWLAFGVLGAFFAYLMIFPQNYPYVIEKITGTLFDISFICLMFAVIARRSFHLYQIRKRALVPFSVFMKDKGAWFGRMPSSSLTAFILLGILTASATAIAQTSGGSTIDLGAISTYMANVNKNDLSLKWLAMLFPNGITSQMQSISGSSSISNSSANTDLFQEMFRVFNSVIMGVACALMTYQTIMGTLVTAHEGKVLGDKWNTAFAPGRIALGVGSLAPIKGYCLAQFLAISVIFAGYALADEIWSVEVDRIVSGTPLTLTSPDQTMGTIYTDMLRAQVCANYIVDRNADLQNSWNPFDWATSNPANANPTLQKMGNGSYVLDWGPICGSIIFPAVVDPTIANQSGGDPAQYTYVNQSSTSFGLSSSINAVTGVTATNYSKAYSQFETDRKQAIQTLYNSVCQTTSGSSGNTSGGSAGCGSNSWPAKLAKMYEPSTTVGDISGLSSYLQGLPSAEQTYDSSMLKSIQGMANAQSENSLQEFKKVSQSLGWASAGALNNSLVQMSSNMMTIYQKIKPDYTGVKLQNLTKSQQDEFKELLKGIDEKITIEDANAFINGKSSSSANAGGDQGTDVIARVFNAPLSAFEANVNNIFKFDGGNPMASMQIQGQSFIHLGTSILVTYYALIGVLSTGAHAGTVMGTETVVSPLYALRDMLSAAGSMILASAGPLIGLGIIESYIIPMIPYIIWVFAILECAIFAVCFVIAAPLAAFMHIRLDGNDFIDQAQKPFYKFLFDGAIRPSLLIFGLIAFSKVFAVMSWYIDQTFSMAMMSATNSTGWGIFGLVADVALLVYMHYRMAFSCMELINRVPSMVAHICGIQSVMQDNTHHANAMVGMGVSLSNTAGRNATSTVTSARGTSAKKVEQSAMSERQAKKDQAQENFQQEMLSAIKGPSGKNADASTEGDGDATTQQSTSGNRQSPPPGGARGGEG